MISVKNFIDNDDVETLDQKGCFQVIQWKRDLSCTPWDAQAKYFMSQMNVHEKQLCISLNDNGVALQAGAMQFYGGNIQMTTGVKGAGDLLKKAIGGAVTGERGIKPEYVGTGVIVTEPTFKHLLIESCNDWQGGCVITDGMFLARETSVQQRVVMRNTISSGVAGGEGLFNLCLGGTGFFVVESPVPREELVEIVLQNDTIKIDGSMAVMWDASLQFTVERSGKSLIGSAASGEGLCNVYRGTGRVYMAPFEEPAIWFRK